MKKQVLFVSAVILSLTFSSCGGEAKEPAVEETTTETTTTTETETPAPATDEAPAVEETAPVTTKKETKTKPKETAATVEKEILDTKTSVKKGLGDKIEQGMKREAEKVVEKEIIETKTSAKKGALKL